MRAEGWKGKVDEVRGEEVKGAERRKSREDKVRR